MPRTFRTHAFSTHVFDYRMRLTLPFTAASFKASFCSPLLVLHAAMSSNKRNFSLYPACAYSFTEVPPPLQIVNFAAMDYPITWSVQSYDPLSVAVGDTVTFTWTGTHGVSKIPTGECPSSFTNPEVVVLAPEAPGGTYVWTASAPGTVRLIICFFIF